MSRTFNTRWLPLGIVLLAMLTLSSGVTIAAGTTERVNLSPSGGEANGASGGAAISANGQFVVYLSDATNLVAGDDNGMADFFVYDRNSGTTERLDLGEWGAQDYVDFLLPYIPSISSNGQLVAFMSIADDLVAGDTNESFDIFIHDRTSGTTERVSVASDGTEGDDWSLDNYLSPDGRFVVFTSYATNLVPNDTNDQLDVFVHDRITGTTERISEGSGDIEADGESYEGSISDDGRYVSFTSTATNLVSETVFEGENVYVHDRTTGETVLVSVRSDGTPGDDNSFNSMMSGNGRYVVFESAAHNFRDDIGYPFPGHVYRHDLTTGDTELVSWRSDDTHWAGAHWDPVVSFDGRYVAFTANFSGLVPEDDNGDFDVFLRDITTGTTEWISKPVIDDVTGNSLHSTGQTMSADGQTIAFNSFSPGLVPDDTNDLSDIFVHERSEGSAPLVNAGTDTMAAQDQPFTRAGLFVDADSTSWTATVDYGDGDGPQALALNPDNTFQLNHVYTDDDVFDVTVEVCDGEGNCGSDTFEVRVLTGPIEVFAGFQVSGQPGEEIELDTASFDAVDDQDDHTATVDWGDGTPLETELINQATNMVFASHTYSTTGEYTVELCVRDEANNEGCDTVKVFVFIPTNNPPSIDFLGYGMDEGDTYTEEGSFEDSDSTSWTATVDYGDGDGPQTLELSADRGFDLSYTYPDDGTYSVTVRICDDGGACGEEIQNVVVVNVAPTVDAGPDQTAAAGATVSLPPATFTDPGTLDTHTATIDWGDGSPEASGTVDQTAMTVSGSHTYTTAGDYTAEVCVTDSDDGEGCDSFTVTVTGDSDNQLPTVDAGSDQTAGIGEVVSLAPATFTDPDTGDTHTATIDWGDGSSVESGTVNQVAGTVSGSHTYTAAGQFTVEVCVTDSEGGEACDSFVVTVTAPQGNQPPSVDAGDDVTINEDDTFNGSGSFTDSDSSSWTATVDYGDGSGVQSLTLSGMSFSLSHVYAAPGQFTVDVCVTDDDGAEGCDTFLITVTETDPPVNVEPLVNAGSDTSINEGGTFTGSGSFTDADSSPWTATVNYGDGGGVVTLPLSGMTFSLSHTYVDDGSYTVTVCVTDGESAVGCDSLTVTVNNIAPTVNAGADQTADGNGAISLAPATYSDPGTLDTHTATINWGDGSPIASGTVNQAANTVSGSHTYFSTGQFTVTVCVTDNASAQRCDSFQVTVDEVGIPPAELCINRHTGVIRMPGQACASHEIVVNVPDDLPITFCVNRYTNVMRYLERGRCAASEWTLEFPDDGPINICINKYTHVARYTPTASCSAHEVLHVLGGAPPPNPRTR